MAHLRRRPGVAGFRWPGRLEWIRGVLQMCAASGLLRGQRQSVLTERLLFAGNAIGSTGGIRGRLADMLHLFAEALAEKVGAQLSCRTRDALQAAKAGGAAVGGSNAKGIRNRNEARQRAELLRPILAELADMTARAIACELNEREVPTPGGGPWHATTVIRVQRRLKGKLRFSFGKS